MMTEFSEFEAAYGDNFGRMWQHIKPKEVKRNPALKLADLKGRSLKNLFFRKRIHETAVMGPVRIVIRSGNCKPIIITLS
jgi:hypothetical protein